MAFCWSIKRHGEIGSGVFRWWECECNPEEGDVTLSHEKGSLKLPMRTSPDMTDRKEGVLLSNGG